IGGRHRILQDLSARCRVLPITVNCRLDAFALRLAILLTTRSPQAVYDTVPPYVRSLSRVATRRKNPRYAPSPLANGRRHLPWSCFQPPPHPVPLRQRRPSRAPLPSMFLTISRP